MTEASAILMGAAIGAVASITTQIIQQVFVRRKDRAVDLAEQFASMWHLEQLYLEEIKNLRNGDKASGDAKTVKSIKEEFRAKNNENGNKKIKYTANSASDLADTLRS